MWNDVGLGSDQGNGNWADLGFKKSVWESDSGFFI